MKPSCFVVALTLLAVPAAAQQEAPLPKGFTKREVYWGYAVGRLLGRGFKARFDTYAHLDWASLQAGFKLGLEGQRADKAQAAKVGYLLGHWVGLDNRRKMLSYLPYVDAGGLAQGFVDGARGRGKISEGQGEDAIFELQEAMVLKLPEAQRKGKLERVREARKRARARRAQIEARRAAGRKFCADYKAKHPEAKTTASGLIYRVIKPGTGRQPKSTESVKVHFEGRVIDGQVFQSTYQHKTPAWFGVTQGLPGWIEAIQMMKVGATWEIVLPPALAYDERSVGRIPSGSTLVFKVELLDAGTKPKKTN